MPLISRFCENIELQGTGQADSDDGRDHATNFIIYTRRVEYEAAESDWVKYGEIIADNLSKAGWSWGCVAALDSRGRTIWIAEAHRDDGEPFHHI